MTDVDTLRMGLLGAGHVARSIAEAARSVDGIEVVAAASRTAATAASFGQDFSGVSTHDRYEAVIDDPTIDVVYIATPHPLHAEQAIASMRAGKDVLCEKPFAVDADEARAIVEVARAERRFCMEAMWMRCFPVIRRVRELVDDGAIGEPRLLLADFGVPTGGGPTSRFFDPALGGGALLDRGVYAVSLATLLFGRPDAVIAETAMTPSGVDEHDGIVLRFPGGALAVLAASLTALTKNEAVVTGTHGRLTIGAPFFCPDRFDLRQAAAVEPGDPSRRDRLVAAARRNGVGRVALRLAKPLVGDRAKRTLLRVDGNGYGYELEEVVRCLRAGELESPLVPLDDSIAVMEILDTIRAAWSASPT